MRASHLGRKKSAEHKDAIRQARLRAGPHSARRIENIRAALAAEPEEAKHARYRRISATMKERGSVRGRNNPHFGKSTGHGPRTHWVNYRGTKLRSSYEVRLAQQFDRRGIEWRYEPRRFDLGDCTYLPDFFLPKLKVFWEAKGYLDPKSQRKIQLFRALHPGTPLIVATNPVIRQMETST